MSKLWRRLRILIHRDRFDSDLEEEMRAHIEMQAEENQENGMPPDEARFAAKRQFGNPTQLKETSRELWGWPLLEQIWQDMRFALRMMAKSPMLTGLAVVSLALGIGLTTGIFSVGDALLLRPFPIERPGELLKVTSRGDDGNFVDYGWPDYLDMVQVSAELGEIAAYQRRGTMLAGDEQDENTITHAVTPNYFSLLGVKAALGQASVESIDNQPMAVLGHRLWQRRFSGDSEIVGKTVVLSRRPFVVAGVIPAEFSLVRGVVTDIWLSTDSWFDVLGQQQERQQRTGQFEMVARLKPGVMIEQAAAQLDASIRGAEKHKPAPMGSPGTILSASFAPGWTKNLVLGGGLLLALSLVLFVACANVVQIRLAQIEARRKELGVRVALGASSWRLTRQFLIETGLLSLAGGGLGILLAQFLMEKITDLISAGSVYADPGIRLDHRVLIFTIAMLGFSVIMTGLAPARHALTLKILDILKSDQGTTGALARWPRKALIVGQVAVSVALIGTVVMFIASLRNATAVRPGLDPAKQLFATQVIQSLRIPRTLWCEQACERISTLPGVVGATFARRLPLTGSGGGMTVRVEIPGREPLGVHLNNVGGNYFSLLGTRVVAGRAIDSNDREGSSLVVVVSQTFARQIFQNRNPLGEWISVNGEQRQIVGVAEDGPSGGLHSPPEPYLYLPFAQLDWGDVTLIVETAGEPGTFARAISEELKQYDPGVTLHSSTTWRQLMDGALSWDRALAALTTGAGIIGILLTAAGLIGLLHYTVNRRTREFGLRIALGAKSVEIHRIVLRESLHIAACGIPIGLVLLGAAAWSVRSLVLGITPLNPFIYLVSMAALLGLMLLAAWFPARRAGQVDPMEALHYE